eukprot:TRINITY_DN25554_c0_g1_i1.p1 TRINITY_DN25554_c0_g1~~TRINITY_DN25554_c0_g1_i1.p1  ORF type:complete len:441 (+),score=67.62 TRINITY_DN25554_c0_g1_i1:61-1323(+)
MSAKDKEVSRKRKRRSESAAAQSGAAQLTSSAEDREKAGLEKLCASLECTVCCHMMFPPIRQCAEGHNICDGCCNVIMSGNVESRKCPTCRVAFRHPVARSRNLEDWAIQANPEVLCDLPDCGARFKYASFGEHANSCPGRTVVCPTQGCEWRGKPADLGKHLACKECADGQGEETKQHGFEVTKAPTRRGSVTYARLTFSGKRQLSDPRCWKPQRQLIELALPESPQRPAASTVTFCVALWKPEGAGQPLLAAVQQLRKASCVGGTTWGCELTLCRGRHALRLAMPVADLDSCNDVWSRPTVDSCTGTVFLVPAAMAPFFNEVGQQQAANASDNKQSYTLTVNLWSDWFRPESHDPSQPDVELPPEIYQPIMSDEEDDMEEGEEEWEWDDEEDEEEEDLDDDDDQSVDLRRRGRGRRYW